MPSPADIQASAPEMRRLFTRVSGGYDRLNRAMSLGLDVLWRRRALARLARAASAPRGILDLATGTADFAIDAARLFPDACVKGVDLTPAMLEIGRHKVSDAGLDGRIELEEGDVCALGCGEDSADVALCAFGFRNFPDRAAALREVARALAPGGYLLVLELFRPRSCCLGALTSLWMKCVAFLFAGGARGDYEYLRASIEGMCSADDFVRMAAEAGFTCQESFFYLPACSCLLFRKNMIK